MFPYLAQWRYDVTSYEDCKQKLQDMSFTYSSLYISLRFRFHSFNATKGKELTPEWKENISKEILTDFPQD